MGRILEELERGCSTTDPRTLRATLSSTAAAFASVRIRERARKIANSAETRIERTKDPVLAARLRILREDALELVGLANLATMLPLPRLTRWRLLWAVVTEW